MRVDANSHRGRWEPPFRNPGGATAKGQPARPSPSSVSMCRRAMVSNCTSRSGP